MWPRNEPMSICASEEVIMSGMEEEMAEREKQADARSAAASSPHTLSIGRSDMNSSNVDDVRLAGALVKFMSAQRASDYKSWICVAFALRGIAADLLPAFHDFSRLCLSKYDAKACDRAWLSTSDRASHKNVTLGASSCGRDSIARTIPLSWQAWIA